MNIDEIKTINMNNKKNKIEIFKNICHYELNQASIITDVISINYGIEHEDIIFDFIIKDAKDVIVALGNMVDQNDIENQIEYLEDKIKKGLLNYDVYIY